MELDNVLPLNNDFIGAPAVKRLVFLSKFALLITPLVLVLLIVLSDTRKPYFIPSDKSAIDTFMVIGAEPIILQNNTPISTKSEQQREKANAFSEAIPSREFKSNEIENLSAGREVVAKGEITPISIFSVPNPEPGPPIVNASPVDTAVTLTGQNYSPVIIDVIPAGKPVIHPIVFMPSTVTTLASETGEANDNKSSGNGLSPAGRTFKTNRFSIGIALTEKNTWLLSQETINGLDRQDLSTTKATFLNDFGIILQYTANERWSFEGTTLLLSKTGQSYNQYIYGIYSSK
ncbi:hypothetical protein EG832_06880, partial [bacterium]|nr:hypothetical protein [bacterium]